MGRRAHVDHTACNLGRLSAAFFVAQCRQYSRHAKRLESCIPGAPSPVWGISVTHNGKWCKVDIGKAGWHYPVSGFFTVEG